MTQTNSLKILRNYTHHNIDFYGMARRGRKWRGNRMIRKK